MCLYTLVFIRTLEVGILTVASWLGNVRICMFVQTLQMTRVMIWNEIFAAPTTTHEPFLRF